MQQAEHGLVPLRGNGFDTVAGVERLRGRVPKIGVPSHGCSDLTPLRRTRLTARAFWPERYLLVERLCHSLSSDPSLRIGISRADLRRRTSVGGSRYRWCEP